MKSRRGSIQLLGAFGKAAASASVLSTAFTYFSLGALLVSAADTTSRAALNPSTYLNVGLVALGVSLVTAGAGYFAGKKRNALAREFNREVALQLNHIQEEKITRGVLPVAERRDYYSPYISRSRSDDGFWTGYWFARALDNDRRGGWEGSSSSRRSGDGKGVAIALTAVALAAAATASTYIAYRTVKENYFDSPELLSDKALYSQNGDNANSRENTAPALQ